MTIAYRRLSNSRVKLLRRKFTEHDQAEVANLVNLYALVSRMRILSSPPIVESADRVVRMIIDTYLAPNKTFRDLPEILDNEAMNPLREFSDVCREELRERGASLAGLRSLPSRMASHRG